MNILCIGNSFSHDATHYLSKIANSNSQNIKVVNLFIGGCTLETHYQNILNDEKNYLLELNGVSEERLISIKDGLKSDSWDYVTIQQGSHESAKYETYMPYAAHLVDYIKKYSEKSKIIVHQTWAYEDGSERLYNVAKFKSSYDMFCNIKKSYASLLSDVNAKGIIPSGELMLKLSQLNLKVHRDTFHASLGIGRYALSLLWYCYLTKHNPMNVEFKEFDEPVAKNHIRIIKEAVNEILN